MSCCQCSWSHSLVLRHSRSARMFSFCPAWEDHSSHVIPSIHPYLYCPSIHPYLYCPSIHVFFKVCSEWSINRVLVKPWIKLELLTFSWHWGIPLSCEKSCMLEEDKSSHGESVVDVFTVQITHWLFEQYFSFPSDSQSCRNQCHQSSLCPPLHSTLC